MVTIRKIKGGEFNFEVATEFFIDNFQVTILAEKQSYFRQLTLNDLSSFATSWNIEINSYYSNLKHYLTNPTDEYIIDVKNDLLTISKKKKATYFRTPLEKIDYAEALKNICNKLYEQNTDVLKNVVVLEKDKNILNDQCNDLKAKLENYTKIQSLREKKLYSCFTLLLNEKKKRIQYLTDALDSRGELSDTSTQRKKPKIILVDNISDSEASSCNTEDDENRASTSKISDIEDDILGKEEVSVVLPARGEKTEVKKIEVVCVQKTVEIEEKNDEEINNDEQDSPVVELSTQDILNMI